ncbi:penicillin-binding protein 1C [candidate division CSSED10-310 bacterium]|uniref:peptidoglycan glycosyltransferase n=1 Tax=candidate division CSSED10-310 bacterium TaxID=2855610 RepID=A0ABV6YXZ9_UNCC1
MVLNRKKIYRLWVLFLILWAGFLVLFMVYQRVDVHLTDFTFPDNKQYVDRFEQQLCFLPDDRGERHLWVSLDQVPPAVRNAFISAEDSRFYRHPGFDCQAILRAAKDNILNRKIVSGASTITQQLVRLRYRSQRSFRGKVIEILKSHKLEKILSKKEILEQYLNRVPMGNNIVGVALAAKTYFGKPIFSLNTAEAALLAALPKAPGYLNPYGPRQDILFQRKDWILQRMLQLGYVEQAEFVQARKMTLLFDSKSQPMEIPHLITLLNSRYSNLCGLIQTTIDRDLQHQIQAIVQSHRQRLKHRGARQAACLVVDNKTMAVLSSVGSFEYGPLAQGYNNGTIALRSPGSTLKPFLYALALEQGYTPATILEDTDRRYPTPQGEFFPVNYDRQTYGPITIRKALGNSLNLSAIKLLNAVGYDHFYECLQNTGLINFPTRGPDYYGLGLVVGNPEVTLEQLVAAYAMLANGGEFKALRYIKQPAITSAKPRPVFAAASAAILSDILSDPGARMLTFGNTHCFNFPFRVSLKTGTSTKYRDCWTIGYTPEYTIGVWVGNFEGHPTYHLSGASAAGPIFADIIQLLYRHSSPSEQKLPPEIIRAEVCAFSGMKPTPYCRYTYNELFMTGRVVRQDCIFHSGDSDFHHLPYNYAHWLYQKENKGVQGNYQLTSLVDHHKISFDDPWKAMSDQPRMIQSRSQSSSSVVSKSPDRSHQSHVSLGIRPDDRLSTPYGALYDTDPIKIIYPLAGDRFVFDRKMTDNSILFQALAQAPIPQITWFVDGIEYAQTGPPYQIYWSMTRGEHRLIAVGPNGTGDSITFSVE